MSQLRGGVLTPIKQRARNALHRGVDRNQRLVLPNHQFDQFPLDPDTTLAFRFDRDRSLTDLINGLVLDFSRASTATWYDSDGILQTAGVDVPRFDYAPVTHQSLGYFEEPPATNLVVESNNFGAAAWAKQRSTVAQDETGPDGVANSAWTITDDAVLGTHAVSQAGLFPTQANRRPSVYLKAGTARYLTLATRNYGSTPSSRVSIFDTQTGTFAHQGAAYLDFKIEPLVNGFWRISKTAFDLNATYDDIWCGISGGPNPLDTSYVGTGETGIFYGVQGELDRTTSYIDTGAATETRAVDDCATGDLSWYNILQGTAFMNTRFVDPDTALTDTMYDISSVSSVDRLRIRRSAPTTTQGFFRTNSVTVAQLNANPGVVNHVKSAIAMAQDDFEHFVNGLRVGTGDQTGDVPGSFSVMTNLQLGSQVGASAAAPMHIAEFGYAETRKSNQFLENITLL